MSRVKTIGGATLLLVLLGVLCVLAQTAEEVPTELYVRTLPSGATIIVDGQQKGTSPRLFEVEPGEHSVTVKREGYQPKTKTVTIREGRIRRVILELSKGPGAGGAAIASAAPLAKPRQVRLLNADKSRQHGTPAVLDLASGELIAQPKTADDEAIAKYWDQLGRGDLAYPGEGLVVLRRGAVEQWNPTTRRFTPAKAIYQEPRGATKPLATGYALENLPLRFRITTGDGKKFDVTVLEKKASGDYIEIEYRPLSKSAGPAQTSGKAPAVAAEPRNETPEDLAKTVVECLRRRDWMALVRFTVVSDDQWQSIEERIRRDLLDKPDADPSNMATRKGSHGEDILQDWRRFVERGERDFDIDWTQAEYECAEYKIVKSQDIVATGKLDFVFSAGGKHYRASIDDVLLTERGWLAADGPKWVGQLDGPVVSVPVETEIVDQVSNPIEIEITPADARPKAPDQEPAWGKQVENPPAGLISIWPPPPEEPAWGKQVENLQCRLRAEKATWTAGTVPKLFGDLRSYDMWQPDLSTASENWEIEIDGKWHKSQRAKLVGSYHYTASFVSGNTTKHHVHELVYELAIDAQQTAARSLRALAPGKHVLRAGYRFDALPPDTAKAMSILTDVMRPHPFSRSGKAVHVVSNPIEIEIVPAEGRTADGTSGEVTLLPFTVQAKLTDGDIDSGIALDLDSGRTVNVASGPDPGSHQQLGNWLYEQHLEVVVRYEGNGCCILGKEVVLKALDADRANDLTVAELRYALAASGEQSERDLEARILPHGFLQIRLDEKEGLPVTLAFQTAAGNLGLLQIEQLADAPKVLQFRRRTVRIQPGTE